MKKEQLMDAIGELDEALIAEAMADEHRPRRNFTALAAAAAVCAGIVIVAVPLTRWMHAPSAGGVESTPPGTDAPITSSLEEPFFHPLAFSPLVWDERAKVIAYDNGAHLIDNLTKQEITVTVRQPFFDCYAGAVHLPKVMAETGPLSGRVEVGRENVQFADAGFNMVEQFSNSVQYVASNGKVTIYSSSAMDLRPREHASGDALVTVYTVTGSDITVEFTAEEDVCFYSYGFEGWNCDATGTYSLEAQNHKETTAYLIAVGKQEGIVPPEVNITLFDGKYLDKQSMPLSEAIEMIVKTDSAALANPMDSTKYMFLAEQELYTQSVIDWLYDYAALSAEPQPRYHTGQLEIILADVRWAPRVFFLTFDLTLPAADSVKIWEEK